MSAYLEKIIKLLISFHVLKLIMQTFKEILNTADKEAVHKCITESKDSLMESAILRKCFPKLNLFDASPIMIYRCHFVLFHILYSMQNIFYEDGRYLYIHFMRTGLHDIPKDGHCRYFDEELLMFCCLPSKEKMPSCKNHEKYFDDCAVSILSDKFFYMDESNFDLLDDETAGKFMDGAFELLRNGDKVAESYDILGLKYGENIENVKKAFREQAKKCHPDLNGVDDTEKFIRLNKAFRFLSSILEKF